MAGRGGASRAGRGPLTAARGVSPTPPLPETGAPPRTRCPALPGASRYNRCRRAKPNASPGPVGAAPAAPALRCAGPTGTASLTRYQALRGQAGTTAVAGRSPTPAPGRWARPRPPEYGRRPVLWPRVPGNGGAAERHPPAGGQHLRAPGEARPQAPRIREGAGWGKRTAQRATAHAVSSPSPPHASPPATAPPPPTPPAPPTSAHAPAPPPSAGSASRPGPRGAP